MKKIQFKVPVKIGGHDEVAYGFNNIATINVNVTGYAYRDSRLPGLKMVLHRDVKYPDSKYWYVSEFTTGLKIEMWDGTREAAIERAIERTQNYIKSYGKDGYKKAIERCAVVNDSKYFPRNCMVR